jgi:hypothetical protein
MKRRFTGFYLIEGAIPDDKFRQMELKAREVLRPMKMFGAGHQRREGRVFEMFGGVLMPNKHGGKNIHIPPTATVKTAVEDVLNYVKQKLDAAFTVVGERVWKDDTLGMRITVQSHNLPGGTPMVVNVKFLISVDPSQVAIDVPITQLEKQKKQLNRRLRLLAKSFAEHTHEMFEEVLGHYKNISGFKQQECEEYYTGILAAGDKFTWQNYLARFNNSLGGAFGIHLSVLDAANIHKSFPSYYESFDMLIRMGHDLQKKLLAVREQIRMKQSATKGAKVEKAVKKLLGNS